jgi:hypothetical protein
MRRAGRAMYAFFKVDGLTERLAFCKRSCTRRSWVSRPAARSARGRRLRPASRPITLGLPTV